MGSLLESTTSIPVGSFLLASPGLGHLRDFSTQAPRPPLPVRRGLQDALPPGARPQHCVCLCLFSLTAKLCY